MGYHDAKSVLFRRSSTYRKVCLMATMKDIENALIRDGINFEAQHEGQAGLISTGWQFEDGRSQMVFLRSEDGHIVIATSPIGRYEPRLASKVLEAASNTAFGVTVEQDHFMLMASQPIGDLDQSELAWMVAALPQAADQLEKAIFGVDTF